MIKQLRNRIKISILNKYIPYGMRHIALRAFLGSIRLYTTKSVDVSFFMKRITHILAAINIINPAVMIYHI